MKVTKSSNRSKEMKVTGRRHGLPRVCSTGQFQRVSKLFIGVKRDESDGLMRVGSSEVLPRVGSTGCFQAAHSKPRGARVVF